MGGTTEQAIRRRTKYRWLYRLEAWLEAPMFILGLVWLWLLIKELVSGLTPTQDKFVVGIWIAFIFEFLLKFILAPRKSQYVKQNWITLVALVIPAFRVFRLVRALRILRASPVTSTTKIIRSLTSAKRFATDIKEAQGDKQKGEMNVGVMISCSRSGDKKELRAFAEQLSLDVSPEIEASTGIKWNFHHLEPDDLESDDPRMPSDFLDDASMRMGEGPYDMVLVVTDVALMSRKRTVEAGLASEVSHTLVISTRKLITPSRGKQYFSLDAEVVRWNATALFLHMLGHIGGLSHHRAAESKVMAPFIFQESRKGIPQFNAAERKVLQKRAESLPERELHGGNNLESFIFHLLMGIKHPKSVFMPLIRNGSFLLALSLPGLATAAVAPTFLLIFTAEIWDVGLNMTNQTAAIYAIFSILGATFYLVNVQSLFFPRKEKRVLTEHLAIANVIVFLSVLLACIGLFVMVALLMLVIELYIFPAGLMNTWPTLEAPRILLQDKLRLAVFISTIGVTTGALAGGLESRTLIRHLALFRAEP